MTFQSMRHKKSSASGSDRLSAALLKALLEKAWDAIAIILIPVEQQHHQWPTQLAQVSLIPIPRKTPAKVTLVSRSFHIPCLGQFQG